MHSLTSQLKKILLSTTRLKTSYVVLLFSSTSPQTAVQNAILRKNKIILRKVLVALVSSEPVWPELTELTDISCGEKLE